MVHFPDDRTDDSLTSERYFITFSAEIVRNLLNVESYFSLLQTN